MLGTARLFLDAGRHQEAALICRTVLRQKSDTLEALYLLGIVEQFMGNSLEAARIFATLLDHEPLNPVAWSNFGVASLALGDRDGAQKCFESAIRIKPDYADAWNNLGTVFEKNDLLAAEECYRRAFELNPATADVCNNLALCCKKSNRVTEAAMWYRRSIDLRSDQPAILYRLGEILEQASDIDGAREAYSKSHNYKPDDVIMLKMETVLPVVLPSTTSVDEIRMDLWANMQQLRQQRLRIERPWERGRVFFYLAYHGRNDRAFHEMLAGTYRSASPELSWQAPHIGRMRVPGERIRVGFISRFFFSHTIAKLNICTVEKLDRSRFHVFVLLIDTGTKDDMTRRFAAAADTYLELSGDFCEMRQKIAAQALDILFYTDIGMEPFTYFLAFARLARLQCVTWGHPATTGIDTVDYFISHEECETEESRTAYSERLFCLSRDAACACYARPDFLRSVKSRKDYGIDSACTLYFCPQPPFKMHPDFDAILRNILDSDPNGCVLLLRGVAIETEALLRQRFAQTLHSCLNRIMFIDPLPYADYMTMLELADVVLDTPHFSGGSSSVEALARGAAVVTLPTPYLKGRLTLAWYRKIGIEECIAHNPEEYVGIAVRLGTDCAFREHIRSRIRGASHLLFEDCQYVRELEIFFQKALHA